MLFDPPQSGRACEVDNNQSPDLRDSGATDVRRVLGNQVSCSVAKVRNKHSYNGTQMTRIERIHTDPLVLIRDDPLYSRHPRSKAISITAEP
jgi:hypothetical protein